MRKEDLKAGYFVETRRAGSGILLPVGDGEFCISDTETCKSHLCRYNDDLTMQNNDYDWDIVRVWGYSEIIYVNFTSRGRELLWERKDYPTLTSGEIIMLETVLKITDFNYIARDQDGEVRVYGWEPEKNGWGDFESNYDSATLVDGFEEVDNFKSLKNIFYSISDLLDRC